MTANSYRVLISGAGVAGSLLARFFKKRGIPFTWIEKRQGYDKQLGVGMALPANALEALDYLGVGNHIRRNAHCVKSIIYGASSGDVLSQASLETIPLNYNGFFGLMYSNLIRILSEELDPKADIHFDTTIQSMELDPYGVSVQFNSESLPHQGYYDLVIGADGVHSGVRQLTFPHDHPIDLGLTNWRWVTHYPTYNLQPTYQLGKNDAVMVYPIGPNQVYCYAQTTDPHQKFYRKQSSQAIVKKLFSHYQGLAGEIISLSAPPHAIFKEGRLLSMPEPRFYQGRVVLVGDASSACSPMLQQGAATACEDVAVVLSLLQYFPIDKALSYYEKYRKDRVIWIMKASDAPLLSLSQMSLPERNKLIQEHGPLNVQGWRQLFRRKDSISELKAFIADQQLEESTGSTTPKPLPYTTLV